MQRSGHFGWDGPQPDGVREQVYRFGRVLGLRPMAAGGQHPTFDVVQFQSEVHLAIMVVVTREQGGGAQEGLQHLFGS